MSCITLWGICRTRHNMIDSCVIVDSRVRDVVLTAISGILR